MAVTATANVIANTDKHYVVHLMGVASDATEETAVIKVDKSTLVAADGAEPASLDVAQARWSIQGFSSVKLLWDHTTDDLGMVMCGSGYEDFTQLNNDTKLQNTKGLADPRSTGATGDIVFTTVGAAAAATYDITLWLIKTND